MSPAAVNDYRELARRRLPRFLFEYIDGGSYAEVTLRRNVSDLEAVALRQRVLRDVSALDLGTELFGQQLRLPLALAPVGLAGMYARRGEVQAARAAREAGVRMCLSTVSACSLDEVAAAVPGVLWFQLYMVRDRGFMRDMLARAAVHCPVLLFTVDLSVSGARYRDIRSGLSDPDARMGRIKRMAQIACRPGWSWDVGVRGRPHTMGNLESIVPGQSLMTDFFAWTRDNFDASVTWTDIGWIREHWKGPLVIKGVLDVEDARAAADCGADGIVVSNHGGRQLDGASSTARALPAIAAALGDRLTVLADGGIRSGLDVVRMLALGARGVLIGRAWAFALAARGEAGVAHVLRLIEEEMKVAMALTGCTRVRDISGDMLAAGA